MPDARNVQVRKRDGSLTPFDAEKIRNAISKAVHAVVETTSVASLQVNGPGDLENKISIIHGMVLIRIRDFITQSDSGQNEFVIDIEKIQDIVETTLMSSQEYSAAKAYITYRYQRAKNREGNQLMLDIDKTMGGYLKHDDWRVKENSNVNYSIGGLILHNSGAITANFWLKNVYTKEIADAHKTAALHLHDLSMFGAYCFSGSTRIRIVGGLTPSFEELVKGGITTCKVYAYDAENDKIVEADAFNPRITKQVSQVAIVTLKNKTCAVCTIDHQWLLADGKTYVEAQNLKEGDVLRSLQPLLKYDINDTIVDNVNIVNLTAPIDMYDLTVPKYENFALHAGGVFVHNCAGWSIRQLLKEGLGGIPDKITSTPAQHLSTAVQQIVNFLGIMQNEWAGAQAFASFDTYLAPFIKKDNMTEKQVKQCIQSFLFGVNTPSRWGCQAPFSNVTFDWVVPSDLADKPAIVGGIEQDFNYGDCQKEVDMFNKCYLEVLEKGDACGRGFQYPIPTYNITKDFDWDTENAQRLFEITAKFGTPYFQNFVNSDLNPNDVRSMCPLVEDTEILIFDNKVQSVAKVKIKDLYNLCQMLPDKKTSRYMCFTPNGWVPFTVTKQDKQRVLRITLERYLSVEMGEHHIQPIENVLGDENSDIITDIEAKSLKVGDRLPFYFYEKLDPKSFYSDATVSNEWSFVTIKKIEEIPYVGDLYCLGIEKDPHYFTLANGLITHNCRLQLDKRELRKRGGGLFGSDEFTGSIGVVTINLPQIGFLAKDEDDFFKRLDHIMDIAKDSLILKRKTIEQLNETGLFPYTRRYLSHFRNHFSTIGICGMNECCLNFLKVDIVNAKGHAFAEKVLVHMRDRMSQYQVETGDLFNLEATPAESTSYRLAKHDKEQFPSIIASGETDPYYTNSSQLPVDYTADVFEALDLQESLQTKYTGGTVFHTFLGESITDWRSCRDLVKAIAYNYRIPYFSISPTFSICPIHGFIAGKEFECPTCKAEATEKLKIRLTALQNRKEQITKETNT